MHLILTMKRFFNLTLIALLLLSLSPQAQANEVLCRQILSTPKAWTPLDQILFEFSGRSESVELFHQETQNASRWTKLINKFKAGGINHDLSISYMLSERGLNLTAQKLQNYIYQRGYFKSMKPTFNKEELDYREFERAVLKQLIAKFNSKEDLGILFTWNKLKFLVFEDALKGFAAMPWMLPVISDQPTQARQDAANYANQMRSYYNVVGLFMLAYFSDWLIEKYKEYHGKKNGQQIVRELETMNHNLDDLLKAVQEKKRKQGLLN